MNTSEVLNRAADLIEERGWVQLLKGGVCEANGACVQIAITDASGGRDHDDPSLRAFADYIGVGPIWDIWDWNDTEGRTKTEVVEALRAAAVIEAAKETAAEPVTQPESVSV